MLKNKIKYLLLLFGAGCISILYNVYYTGIIFLTLCILPLLLYGIVIYCRQKIEVDVVSTVHVVNKTDKMPVSVKLKNETIFPISFIKIFITYQNLYSDKKYKKNFFIPVDARTQTAAVSTLYSECAGNVAVTVDAIRIYDYFRVFSLKKKVGKSVNIAVLPLYYEIAEFEISKNALIVESDSYHPTKKGDDPSEVFEIREYREGDRPQRIHWKLSSKLNQLMIKELSYPLNSSVLLYVNLCIPTGEQKLYYIDSILECALSISYTFLMKQQVHYICWSNDGNGTITRIRITQEEELFEAVDGLLHAALFQGSQDLFAPYLTQYPHEQYADTYFITADLAAPWVDTLGALKTQFRHILYIKGKSKKETEAKNEEVLQLLEDSGMKTWSIPIDNMKQNMEILTIS